MKHICKTLKTSLWYKVETITLNRPINGSNMAWVLFDYLHNAKLAVITYCPFCGEKLKKLV
jgi:hypothetical protein